MTTGECPSTGRTQYPMAEKGGKEETDKFLSMLAPVPTPSLESVLGGTLFAAGFWLLGAAPGNNNLALAPNCAASIKVLAMGHISFLLFDVQIVVKFMEEQDEEKVPQEDLRAVFKFVGNLAGEGLQALKVFAEANGSKVVACKLSTSEAIYIPQGWIVAESASAEAALHYGVRKSFLVASSKAVEDYTICTKLMKGAGKKVDRMGAIVEVLTATLPAEPLAAPVG